MFIERNIVCNRYGSRDFDDSDSEKESEQNYTVWVISKDVNVLTPYTYDEAISLAGHGSYTIGLLAVCSLSLLAMCIEMFGVSTVVSSSSCDLDIEPWQYNLLLSMPFLGSMVTAYAWGYFSDTRGRQLSLVVAMWGSFLATAASAFSPNWIVLAALKFISVAFCSSAQSSAYTLMGECCPINVKQTYLLIQCSIVHLSTPIYTAFGYATLNMSFAWNLGFIIFTPWRLMVLCLSLPLGVSAVGLHFFYESPKFLANVGAKGLALENLRSIWRRNSCVGKKYPVEKLILEEVGNAPSNSTPLSRSLWEQTVPLFKRPLLCRTLQLYFINIVMYAVTNSLLMWFPYLTDAFITGMVAFHTDRQAHEASEGVCNIIEHAHNLTDLNNSLSCIPKSNMTAVWASAIQGLSLFVINICISKVPDRKMLIIVMMIIVSASSAGCALIENNIISLFLFFTIFLGIVVNGIMCSYFVDLFPTSYRGMAASLSVMVARASGLVGSNVSGLYLMTHCSETIYVMGASVFCGVLVACFLPSDRAKQIKPA